MKAAIFAPLAFLAVAGCSQPNTSDPAASPANGSQAADVAAHTRADGTIIDESQPHEHSAADADQKPMDHAAMMGAMMPKPNDSAATKGYKQAMMRMMQGSPPYTGDADIDFNKQMRIHHLAAVDMAEAQLAHGKDPASKALAQKVITDQRKEIAQIDAWLQQRGQ